MADTIYPNQRALSTAENIPLAIIRISKAKNAPGFSSNGTVNWTRLQPWLTENMTVIEAELNDTLEFYKKESAKREVILKDLEISKRRGEYLDPNDVKEFLNKVALAQNALFISRMKELPVKLAGKTSQEIDKTLKETTQEICSIFSKSMDKWKGK